MVKVYPVFERFWHWAQVALIMVLLFTGLGMNGVHDLMYFGHAARLHTLAALVLIGLWVFGFFWVATTGAWRQFVPRLGGIPRIVRFYAWGVFRGEQHPYRKLFRRKHNPLQEMAYFGLATVVFPAVWISGLLALSYNLWEEVPDATWWLTAVANVHLLGAWAIAAFVVMHVYMLTIGHSFRAHVRPMVTGYDTVELTPEQAAYLETNEPWRLGR